MTIVFTGGTLMKLSAPASSIFLLERAAPTSTILMKSASSSPGVGFNQHRLWTSACRTLQKTGHKIPCQKSQVGRVKQRRRSLKTSSHHWTGGIGGVGS